jgi:hypothetical protein
VTVTGFVMKILDGDNTLEQMKSFKDLILEGSPSIIELVAKMR